MEYVDRINEIQQNCREDFMSLNLAWHKCDNCKKVLENETLLYLGDEDITICAACGDNPESMFPKLKCIDRKNYSEDEKSWLCDICDMCDIKLEGEWYTGNGSDICIDCYPNFDTWFLAKLNSDIFKYETESLVSNDSGIPMKLDHVTSLRIPDSLEVIDEPCEWLHCVGRFCSIDRKIVNPYHCLMIEKEEEMPHYSARCGLLVDCSPDGKGQIVSICFDNHGRGALNVIYDSPEQYFEDLKEWEENKLPEEELKQLNDKLSGKYEYDSDELKMVCPTFSNYIRIHKELGLYYG